MNPTPKRRSLEATAEWPYLASSAVLSTFAAESLRPMGEESPDFAKVAAMIYRHAEPIKAGPAQGRWRLLEDVRRRVLATLKTRDRLQTALAANFSEVRDFPTEKALFELLTATDEVKIGGRSLEDLLGLQRAVGWLETTSFKPRAEENEIARWIVRERLLAPLRRLVVGFEGRDKELAALRAYVDYLPSESFSEKMVRGVARLCDVFRSRPPLVIHGPGGAGKSSLLAQFILKHAGGAQEQPLAFAILDFDGATLDPGNPDALLSQIAEQVRVQFPEEMQILSELEDRIGTRIASEDRMNVAQSAHYEASSAVRGDFVAILNELSSRRRQNFLLVIDTFEIVQRRGPSAVYGLLTFVGSILQSVGRLRVVIVGRGQLRKEDFPFSEDIPEWLPLPLLGFGPVAGRAYLRSRLRATTLQVSDADLDRIVTRVRGNPLGLRLAARVFARDGVAGVEETIDPRQLVEAVADEQILGLLHARILEHLENEDLRKLASPGLVVRLLTVEVIREVLAAPCGIDLKKVPAEALFEKMLSEVSLVEPDGSKALRHRADVRLIMLPALRRKLGAMARSIDDAAVRFWEAESGGIARAEETYHRIWRHDPIPELDRRWHPDARPYLEDALEEFETETLAPCDEVYIWLCQKLDRELPEALRQRSDQRAWERDAAVKAANLISERLFEDALRLIRERPDESRSTTSALWLIEADILHLLGNFRGVLDLLERILGRSREASDTAFEIAARLKVVAALEAMEDHEAAVRVADEALGLSVHARDEKEFFTVGLKLSRLYRKTGHKMPDDLRNRLRELAVQPQVKQLLNEQPTLLREAAAEVGREVPEVLAMAIERLGLASNEVPTPMTEKFMVQSLAAHRDEFAKSSHGGGPRMGEYLLARGVKDGKLPAAALSELATAYATSVDRLIGQTRR